MSVTGPKLPVTLVDYDGQPISTANPLPVSGGGGGGGGGAVTVANGADTAQGSTTDAAVTDPSVAATVIALLKGLLTFLRVSAAGLGKSEDAPHVSGDTGIQMLAVRNDAGTAFGADGDYIPLSIDAAGRLRATVSGGASGGTSTPDDSAFAVGTDSITPIGGLFDDSSPDSVDEGDVGAVRMSGNRALHVELRDAAGNERGVNINASNQMSVVGPLTDTELRATAVPVSAAALPLPTGAATEATLAAASAKLPATLGQKTMANSLATVIASDQSAIPVTGPVTDAELRATAVPVSGPLTDAQLRASAVPVSAAALPLPTGAATEATLAAQSAKLPATLGQKTMAASLAVVVASDQSTMPVSAASLPLPTGAATEATLAAQSAKLPATLGQKAKAASLAVTLASDEDSLALLGAVNETAPASDTASSGLNGRLQRIAQRITSLIALIPAALGQGTMAQSFRVVVASDQSAVPVSGTVTANVSGTMEVTNDAGNPLPVSTTALVPGTAATNLGKAEDAVHASGDVGVMALGVRQDTPAALAAAGDYVPPTFGANNELFAGLATRLDAVNDFISAVPASSLKTTYRIAIVGLVPAAAATNILELKGSASKTVKITKINVSGVATAAGAYAFAIRKQSTADSGGTSSVPTIVPLDSNNAAASATVKQYSANPTLGTLVGLVAARRGTVSTAAGAIPEVPVEFKFGESVGQELVLRGVAQGMAISLEGATMTGGLLDIELEFTEE